MKKKIYDALDFAQFEVIDGVLQCPAGDYRSIIDFGRFIGLTLGGQKDPIKSLKFDEFCTFGSYTQFPANSVFEGECRFGAETEFAEGCLIKYPIKNSNGIAFTDAIFHDNCKIVSFAVKYEGCTFYSKIELKGEGNILYDCYVFGDDNKFGPETQFSSNTVISGKNIYDESCFFNFYDGVKKPDDAIDIPCQTDLFAKQYAEYLSGESLLPDSHMNSCRKFLDEEYEVEFRYWMLENGTIHFCDDTSSHIFFGIKETGYIYPKEGNSVFDGSFSSWNVVDIQRKDSLSESDKTAILKSFENWAKEHILVGKEIKVLEEKDDGDYFLKDCRVERVDSEAEIYLAINCHFAEVENGAFIYTLINCNIDSLGQEDREFEDNWTQDDTDYTVTNMVKTTVIYVGSAHIGYVGVGCDLRSVSASRIDNFGADASIGTIEFSVIESMFGSSKIETAESVHIIVMKEHSTCFCAVGSTVDLMKDDASITSIYCGDDPSAIVYAAHDRAIVSNVYGKSQVTIYDNALVKRLSGESIVKVYSNSSFWVELYKAHVEVSGSAVLINHYCHAIRTQLVK